MKLTLACMLLIAGITMATRLRDPIPGERRPSDRHRNCHEHKAEIEAAQDPNRPLLGVFIPKCEDDGTYSPVQCRGAGCVCYAPDGEPLHDYQAHIVESYLMSCKCARAEYAQFEFGIGVTHRCDRHGNYQPVQCRGTACYCADEDGNQRYDIDSVHIVNMDTLDELC